MVYRMGMRLAMVGNSSLKTSAINPVCGEKVTIATHIFLSIANGMRCLYNGRTFVESSSAVPAHVPPVCSEISVKSKSIAKKLMPIASKLFIISLVVSSMF